MAEIKFTPEELETEEWRPVVGLETLYEISSLGRVRKLFATMKGAKRDIGSILKLSCPSNPQKYPEVALQGSQTIHRVHILVANAFLGKRPRGYEVNHIDGNKCNTRLSNFEYVTPSENAQHAFRTGLRVPYRPLPLRGEHNPSAKLTEQEVIAIRQSLLNGRRGTHIATEMNVTPMTISHIKSGKKWAHVEPLKTELAEYTARQRPR